jgi:hypothetical protein
MSRPPAVPAEEKTRIVLSILAGVSTEADGEDIAATINEAEARVRKALPSARIIYLEPDIYRADTTIR